MRTRNQSKRSEEASRGKDVMESVHDSDRRICMSHHDSGNLTNKSKEAVSSLLECTYPQRVPGDRSKLIGDDGQEAEKEVLCDVPVPANVLQEGKITDESFFSTLPEKEDTDGSDWEDGYIAVSDPRNHNLDNRGRELIIQFNDSPSSSNKKPIRRASAEEKELAELVHKVHLLCLLARGRLVDSACNDPLIQASLLSLLPRHLLKMVEVPKLTVNALTPIVNWFHNNFHIRSSSISGRSFKSSLASALENQEGTAEEVAALSVALFRALNLTTRFVCILDVASLKPNAKPDTDMSGCPSQNENRVETGIFNSSTLMVAKPSPAATSVPSCKHKTGPNGDIVSEDLHRVACQIKRNNPTSRTIESKSMPVSELNDKLDSSVSKANDDTSTICPTKKVESSKRKGDLEFELQLEMALTATAAGVADRKLSSDLNDLPSSMYDLSSLKRIKRIKSEESPVSSQGISTAVGSRKTGPPLYWAEIFCSGENLTGKWVHVDVVNAIIDGEDKVEAACVACRKLLRYVVAFAGHGAKDVTRRYCMLWYKIASKRVNSHWWDAVLAPLKELESGATGVMVDLNVHHPEHASNKLEEKASMISGSVDTSVNEIVEGSSAQESVKHHGSPTEKLEVKPSKKHDVNTIFQSSTQGSRVATRNTLEDMELQTRALTEPLPTNQQAYKNHPLYAIERWLNKYQILHPKGPVLGFCSGHPVYPRTCVQMLQTKQRWLQEGLQIKASESPAKVVKRSLKFAKAKVSESGDCEEDNDDGCIALYGKWQTEPLDLPCAVNGIVPKNERGQVDVWSEKCLPPGTVHLRLPRVVPVAKRLEINFAPAMVGFEFRNGRSVPVFDGIVVCTEFKGAIMEAYAEEEERRDVEEKKRNEVQALSRWYQLLSSIITRQRLNETYGEGSSSEIPHHHQKDDVCGVQISRGNDMLSNDCRKGLASKSDFMLSAEDHEHIFPTEGQSFDEENSVRTKRCPCGFSVEVEEL